MYKGLPREYEKRTIEYFKKRTCWTALVLYDNSIVSFILRKQDNSNCMEIASLKISPSKGIQNGRIVNGSKAAENMKHLLQSVSEEAGVSGNRVLIGLDTPPLQLNPKQWNSNACLNEPCNQTTYKRILHNIIRESTFKGQHIIEIIPTNIFMDERLVDSPFGITGQIEMDTIFISLSDKNTNDLKYCLGQIQYKCEGFFSGFYNLCRTFSQGAIEDECTILIDLKYNSTDVLLFRGDQPIAMKCLKQGLDTIVIESLSSFMEISKNDAMAFFEKYLQNSTEQDSEIIGKDQAFACPSGLKFREMHEVILGQMKNFIYIGGGINDMLTELRRSPREMPRKMIITGEGARIPEIEVLFQKKLNIRTEAKSLVPSRNDLTMPATAYGMALSIARDMKAHIQL